MDLNFPPPLVIGYLLLLLLSCWTAGNHRALPPPGRTALIVLPAVLVSCLGIALLNLLYWTPIGSNYILGLQGRYFFPLTPAIFLLACSTARRFPRQWLTRWSEARLNAMAVTISLVVCGCFLISVYHRFYG